MTKPTTTDTSAPSAPSALPTREFRRVRTDLHMQAAWLTGPAAWLGALLLAGNLSDTVPGWMEGLPLPPLQLGAGLLLLTLVFPLVPLVQTFQSVRVGAQGVVFRRLFGGSRRMEWSDVGGVSASRTPWSRTVRLSPKSAGGRALSVPAGFAGFGAMVGAMARGAGVADPGIAPVGHGAVDTARRWLGAGLVIAFGLALAEGMRRMSVGGELTWAGAAIAAGVAVPGIGYLLVRRRPGELAVLWPALQVCLWMVPALGVWVVFWAQPTTLLSLTGWTSAGLAVGTGVATILLPGRAIDDVDGGPDGAGADRVPAVAKPAGPALMRLAMVAVAAGIGPAAWWVVETDGVLPVRPAGEFVAHEDYKGSAEPLTDVVPPTDGRWFAVVANGGTSDGASIPVARGRLANLGHEPVELYTPLALAPARKAIWTPDGASVAVVCGLKLGPDVAVTSVEFLFWESPEQPRATRSLTRPGRPMEFRGAAWLPGGTTLALLAKPESPPGHVKLHLLNAYGGDRRSEVLLPCDGTLAGCRPDGSLVLELADDGVGPRVVVLDPQEAARTAAPPPRGIEFGPPQPGRPGAPRPPDRGPDPRTGRSRPPSGPEDGERPVGTASLPVATMMPRSDLMIGRSPSGRFVVGRAMDDSAGTAPAAATRPAAAPGRTSGKPKGDLIVRDHWKGRNIPIAGGAAAEAIAGLPLGAVLESAWSADGSTMVVAPYGAMTRMLVVQPEQGRLWTVEPAFPGEVGGLSLSPDGSRLAYHVAAGSPGEWVSQLRRRLTGGSVDDNADTAAPAGKATVPGKSAKPGTKTPPAKRDATRSAQLVPDDAGIRNVIVISRSDGTGAKRVDLLPGPAALDALGPAPWIAFPVDEPSAAYILLRRPFSARLARQVWRVTLP